MNSGAWSALGVMFATLLTVIVAPKLRERTTRRLKATSDTLDAQKTLTTNSEKRVDRLFEEYDKLRATYRSDLDDVRAQLRESSARVALLELEVAEWRAGVRGVVGVWVAVPSHVWDFVRQNLPELPATRFPGETLPFAAMDDDHEREA